MKKKKRKKKEGIELNYKKLTFLKYLTSHFDFAKTALVHSLPLKKC